MCAATVVELLHASTLWRLERSSSRDGRTKFLVRRPRSDSATRRAELRHEFGIRGRLPQGVALYPRAIERRDAGIVLLYDDFPGQPLAARKTLRWQPDAVEAFARNAAEALATLHHAGVIHGGLYPGSILVADDGAIRFTEFTAAGVVSQATVVDETSRIGAELAYVAPEQTGRMNRPIDQRCDLYALGVILYELLSGAPPFVSADPLELIHSHMTAKPPPLHGDNTRSRRLIAVIQRLLAKEPADRFADANQLLAALSDGEQIHDATATLRLPGTLYGREQEKIQLRDAFAQVSNGVCVLALVSGSAGAGKSSLVFETLRPVGAVEGLFVAGTCDPLRRGAPFAAIFDVARGLIQYVLTLDNTDVEQWRTRMEQGMGPFLPVLTTVVVDAIALFGELEEPPPLPPADAQRRLERTLQRFITAFARAQRPLIVFLDDMQWVDAASLRLIESLLYDAAGLHLLIVGAYRNEAVAPRHRLTAFIERSQQLPTTPIEVRLGPLDEVNIRALLHDTLGFGKVDSLVDELVLRTGGNPLFVREFLRFLDRQRLLHYDTRRAAWELRSLSSAVLPDSVAELLGAELRQLPVQTQRVLQHAACIGMYFDTQALAELVGWSTAELRDALAPALELDLLVADGPGHLGSNLRFLHDRIRQEAFAPLDHADRGKIHAAIGRRLLAHSGDYASLDDAALFDLVDHLNSGAGYLDEQERQLLIRLNLAAARRAKASATYQVARALLRIACELADGAKPVGTNFDVRAELIECEHLAGDNAHALQLLDALEPEVEDLVARLRLADLRVILGVSAGETDRALAAGRRALAAAGVHIPESAEACRLAVAKELATIEAFLERVPLQERISAPAVANPVIRATLTLLADMLAPANMLHPQLYSLINTTQIRLSIEHGHTDVSAYTYAVFGYFLATAMGRYEQAEAFGRFALELNEALANAAARCRIRFVFATYAHFFRPLSAVLNDLNVALADGLESGDYIYLSSACSHILIIRLSLGDPLDALSDQADEFLELMERTRVASSIASQRVARQLIAALRGKTLAPHRLADESFDEDVFIATCEAKGRTFALHWYATVSLYLAVLYGRLDRARELLDRFGDAIRGNYVFYFATEFATYACLALFDLATAATSADEREALLVQIDVYRRQVEHWAEACEANYGSMAQLLAAEMASVRGDESDALAGYDAALASARAQGLSSREALICERAAAYHQRRHRNQLAQVLRREASDAYQLWGASRRVAVLQESLARREAPPKITDVTTADLDLRSILQASQVLSSTLRFEDLLRTVMRIVALTGSATRAALILDDEDQGLHVAATSQAQGPLEAGPKHHRLDSEADTPVTAIRLAFRTRRQIVLDAREHGQLRDHDTYLARVQPRSALCVPLVFQSRVLGVLYLEHRTTTGVFTPTRREALEMLASQIAISLEHANMYANVERAREQAEAANRAKSTFLATMSHELRTPLNSILGYTELILEESAERGETESHEDLNRVLRAGEHLLEVISDILDLSKIEAERIELMVAEFSVRDLLEGVVEATAPAVSGNGNTFIFDPPADLGTMHSDQLRLRQILLNLLSNAAKFTRHGTITLGAARVGQRIRFVVQDTGIGITAVDLERIFDAFAQVDGSATRRFGGTGLGLTISQRLAMLMGGGITVDSKLGKGSRFTVELPTQIPSTHQEQSEKQQS